MSLWCVQEQRMDIGGIVTIFVVMKERKMWTKFKHWLIRKLGGYVAPCVKCNEYKNTLIEITRPVETIRAMYRIDDPIWVNRDDAHDVIKNAIRYDIGSSVMHGDYIKFTEHDGCIYGSLKVVRQV